MEKGGHSIVQCQNCGLVYVNPRIPTSSEELYAPEYFDYYILTERVDKMTYHRRLGLVERFVEKDSILDVGSSTGGFLEVAKERGWNPHGLDIVDHYRRQIREKLGIDIQIGEFMDVPLQENSFTAINMGDSIEHMEHPKQALSRVYSILRKGGVLFIRTPDVESLSARFFRRKWIHYKPKEHLYYFSRTTLRQMLEQIGFRILQIGYSGTSCSLNILANRITHYYPDSLSGQVLQFLTEKLRLGKLTFQLNALDEVQIIARK